jgi:hypothetical protein
MLRRKSIIRTIKIIIIKVCICIGIWIGIIEIAWRLRKCLGCIISSAIIWNLDMVTLLGFLLFIILL